MNVNLIFALIFAIIVMLVVLIFGGDQIINMISVNEQASFNNKITEFEDMVTKVSDMSMGSTQNIDINIPSTYDKLCFVDINHPQSNPSGGWELTNIIERMIENNGYNFFLFEKDKSVPKGKLIPDMVPSENFCISGETTLWIENKGKYVSVSK